MTKEAIKGTVVPIAVVFAVCAHAVFLGYKFGALEQSVAGIREQLVTVVQKAVDDHVSRADFHRLETRIMRIERKLEHGGH